MRDFDAAWKEREREPVTFKVYGQVFTLPRTLPAIVPLRIQAIQDTRGENAPLTASEVEELAPLIIGREAYDHMIDSGASLQQVSDVIAWAVQEHAQAAGVAGEVPEGNLQAPAQAG